MNLARYSEKDFLTIAQPKIKAGSVVRKLYMYRLMMQKDISTIDVECLKAILLEGKPHRDTSSRLYVCLRRVLIKLPAMTMRNRLM